MSLLISTAGTTTTFSATGDTDWEKLDLSGDTRVLQMPKSSFGFKKGFNRMVVSAEPPNTQRNRRAELYFGKPLYGTVAFLEAGELAGSSGAEVTSASFVRILDKNQAAGKKNG